MGKDLSKMTLEELWALFPIFLVPHDDRWKDSFNEIRQTLTGLLAAQPVVRISHIGSTAIQGIWAKNIVDVMIEIPQSADMKDIALKTDLRIKYIISICGTPGTMMNCTSVII